jgi:hypothetical protein
MGGAKPRLSLQLGLAAGLLSLLAHGLVIRLLPRLPAPAPPKAAAAAEVTFSVAELRLPTPSVLRIDATAPQVDRVVSAERKPKLSLPRAAPARASVQSEVIPEPPASEPQPPVETASLPLPAKPGAPDLSPRAAALATMPPSAAAVPAAVDPGVEASATLSADLRAVANVRPARARGGPTLTHDADGTCHYAGEAIMATIRPDDGVEFADNHANVTRNDGVAVPPAQPTTLEELTAPRRAEVRLRVEPRAWQAERDWFLRETKQLRTQLSDAARDREQAQDEIHLHHQLDRIWCDTTVTVVQRRRRLFELWDETSPDAIGARGRQLIAAYVRERLAAMSGNGFEPGELADLNARRSQTLPFDPYVTDSGVGTP